MFETTGFKNLENIEGKSTKTHIFLSVQQFYMSTGLLFWPTFSLSLGQRTK